MEISSYHYGKTYTMSLRYFCWSKRQGGLTEIAILKSKGKEQSASASLLSKFLRLFMKRASCLVAEGGREDCGRKSSSLL